MENEKIRIGLDQYKLRRETDIMPTVLASCSTLKRSLNAVGVKLTVETLKDAMSGCNIIESQIREQIKNDVAGLKNPMLIQTITAGIDSAIESLKEDVKRLTALFEASPFLFLLKIEDEVPSLVDNWQNILQERATTYISDPREIAVYRAQLKVIEYVNVIAEQKGSKVILQNIVPFLFEIKNEKAEFQALNYSAIVAEV
jgi:hypothetical protein